ncbi:MAG: thioredoxin-disulfide reductase [Candidatus Omnitrophota bacterium]
MAHPVYDVVVIGGGGAGLTSAIYTARANLLTMVLEKMAPGGQIATTDLVENYPGFPDGIVGPEIAMRMEGQAKKYGAEIVYDEAVFVEQRGKNFSIKTQQGLYEARALILTTGASFRKLGVSGEQPLTGKGVSYCATCDGAFFKNKKIAVVGGGDSAIQEGIFLTRFASQVTVIHRRDKLRATPILQERAMNHPKIDFIWDSVVEAILGEKSVNALEVKNVKTGKLQKISLDGIFIFIGHDPNTQFLQGFIDLDDRGYVRSRAGVGTSVPGVFAAGEIRAGATRQLVAACGEGCTAALAAQAYLEGH